jgi:hypothetical protein
MRAYVALESGVSYGDEYKANDLSAEAENQQRPPSPPIDEQRRSHR